MIVNKFPFFSGGGSHIYGVSWNGTSTTLWTRTDDAANFSNPVPYLAGATNYGSPFDNLYPWKDMTIVEDAQAGTMVKIPKFWYKLTQNDSSLTIQIADYAADGFSVCPTCSDRGDGKGERDFVLVGRYHCASDYKSKAGVKPKGSTTRPNFRTGIQGLGTGIYMMDWAMLFTIQILYLVEYADWNSQNVIGYGCGDSSSTMNMGYTDSMPYHTGTTLSSRTTSGIGTQYRHIEGLWDNVRDWIDGCFYIYNGGSYMYIGINPADFCDVASLGNIPKSFKYIKTSGAGSSGYIKSMQVFTLSFPSASRPMFIPNSSGGTETTYICDSCNYGATNKPCICIGGDYRYSGSYGLFYLGLYGDTNKYAHIGSRPMKLP